MAACTAAAAVLLGLHAVVDHARRLARCLLLRRLLSAAVAAEAASAAPEAAAALEAAALLGPAERGVHICDLLGLPRPPHSKARPVLHARSQPSACHACLPRCMQGLATGLGRSFLRCTALWQLGPQAYHCTSCPLIIK
jgi:hypothetical protein